MFLYENFPYWKDVSTSQIIYKYNFSVKILVCFFNGQTDFSSSLKKRPKNKKLLEKNNERRFSSVKISKCNIKLKLLKLGNSMETDKKSNTGEKY